MDTTEFSRLSWGICSNDKIVYKMPMLKDKFNRQCFNASSCSMF